MLVQLPLGASHQAPEIPASEQGDAFETALRRDLASAPMVSYESVLGGWGKRALDLGLTLATSPIWLPTLSAVAAWKKLHASAPVFRTEESIGYGGRTFARFAFALSPPVAIVEQLRPRNDDKAHDLQSISRNAEDWRAKWRRVLEGLPQVLNVLCGDMSLVGPSPLTPEQLDVLKSAKRYYLSARPGLVGIAALAGEGEEESNQYKGYYLAWSLTTDALLAWDGLRSLRNRGALWTPRIKDDAPIVASTAQALRIRSQA
jgi:lipopolysaccharide/colanic/teichoic acid biosynthesis glycosyltransferase